MSCLMLPYLMQADDGDEEEVYTDSSTFLKVSVIDVLDSDK